MLFTHRKNNKKSAPVFRVKNVLVILIIPYIVVLSRGKHNILIFELFYQSIEKLYFALKKPLFLLKMTLDKIIVYLFRGRHIKVLVKFDKIALFFLNTSLRSKKYPKKLHQYCTVPPHVIAQIKHFF